MKKILKTLSRCKTFNHSISVPSSGSTTSFIKMVKSKSFDLSRSRENSPAKKRVVPEGCFTVYVGSERERFVIKTDCVNHPLFKVLLEEAEMEYGFCSEGPLALPCTVEHFNRVLWEMSYDDIRHGCSFTRSSRSFKSPSPFRLLSPTRG